MVAAPASTALATPGSPARVATAGLELAHATCAVRSCVVASLKTPVAVKGCRVPLAMVGWGGVTCNAISVAAVTVTGVEPVTAPDVAESVAVPAATALQAPGDAGSFETAATEGFELAHATWPVRSRVVASLKTPVATRRPRVPEAREGYGGVTSMATRVVVATVTAAD